MSGSLNKVQLIGRLGKDPELKYTQGGDAVVNFSIATDETWKDKSGEKQQKTTWHDIVAWKQLAEIIGQYLAKGAQVYIEGKLQTRSWEDGEGNKKYKTEIVANQLIMLGGKSEKSDEEQVDKAHKNAKAKAASKGAGKGKSSPEFSGGVSDNGITDDDIPF